MMRSFYQEFADTPMAKKYTQHELDEAKSEVGINGDIKSIKESVGRIESNLEKNYVSNDRFSPIQKIVYGMVAIILSTALVAILAKIINK